MITPCNVLYEIAMYVVMFDNREPFLKTHQISVHTKNQLDWAYSLTGGDWKQAFSPNFIDFFGHYRPKNQPMWPKRESVVKIHPTSVDTKFALHCVNNFSDNSPKPPM